MMSASPRSTWMDLGPGLAASNIRIAPRSTPTLTTMCFSTLPPDFSVPGGFPPCVTGSVIYSSATTINEGGSALLTQSTLAANSGGSSSPSTTSSAVIATSTTGDLNPPQGISIVPYSASNTPDPSDATLTAPSTGVFSPVASSRGAYSASSDMSSRGATTFATSSMLRHSDEPSAPASSSQGSVTSASEGHPTSTTPEATGSGRAAPIGLPLIIEIVGTVLLVVLGAFGVCARFRWRVRMAAKERSTVYGCPASESSSYEKSEHTVVGVDEDSHPDSMLALEAHRLATDTSEAVFPADSTRDLANGSTQLSGADESAHTRGQPGVALGAHPEHTPGPCACLVEDQPPREPCRNESNATPFDETPPDEDLPSRWPSTPPAYAPTRYPQRFSVSSLSSTQARPFGPRPPLLSYSQLYGNQEDGTSEQTQSAGNGTYPGNAEDGGVSLAGGPLHGREARNHWCESSGLDLGADASCGDCRGSVSTSGSRTLPPPYQER